MKLIYLISTITLLISCGKYQEKKTCGDCYYTNYGTEVYAGQFCDEELTDVEENGYSAGGASTDVHCEYFEK